MKFDFSYLDKTPAKDEFAREGRILKGAVISALVLAYFFSSILIIEHFTA